MVANRLSLAAAFLRRRLETVRWELVDAMAAARFNASAAPLLTRFGAAHNALEEALRQTDLDNEATRSVLARAENVIALWHAMKS